MLPVLRRTWAPCGVTPTLSVRTRSHETVSGIGALIVSPRRRQLTLTVALYARLNIRGPQVQSHRQNRDALLVTFRGVRERNTPGAQLGESQYSGWAPTRAGRNWALL